MGGSSELDGRLAAMGARFEEVRGISVPADYGDPEAEYTAALSGVGLFDARERGLIEVSGKDRAAWLHNLVTNAVKTLQPGEGNYAFAINAKGRILFDCNILILPDAIWLDIDQRLVPKAMAHFERYHITEDIALADRSDVFGRIALAGPKAAEIVTALGATQAAAMASLGSTAVPLQGKHRLMVRHDLGGLFGVELYIETADMAACWDRLLEIGAPVGLRPAGRSAMRVLRIEAGIPLYGEEIDEEVLPAETQQIERGISFVKGCYLGQEVVERMRSRGSLARTLVGLVLAGEVATDKPVPLQVGDAAVGRLMSACHSFALGKPIGLGYVKTAHAQPGEKVIVAAAEPVEAEVAGLAFRRVC